MERFYMKNELRFEFFKGIYITQQKRYAVDCLGATLMAMEKHIS